MVKSVMRTKVLLSQCRPITCIEVTKDFIFICEGSGLVIFDNNKNVIWQKVIFPLHKTVLGIAVSQHTKNSDLVYIFAFGVNFSQLYYFSVQSKEIQYAIDETCVNNEVTYLAARWLNNGLKLAAITDENVLHIWSWRYEYDNGTPSSENLLQDGQTTTSTTCSKVRGVQTSLFSAALSGSTDNNLIVFSGTNLSSILIWAPQDSQANYHIVLGGLKGSVLSLKFCYENQILVASTDQRSVFMWKFNSSSPSSFNDNDAVNSFGPESFINNRVTVYQIAELTGHTGRIWQVDIARNYVVSAGQDANIFLWDTKGNLLKAWSGSTSVSVRCCRFSPYENSVVSGADDGSIYKWNFSTQRCTDKTILLSHTSSANGFEVSNVEYPRHVVCYNVNHFLVSMSSGKFILVNTEGHQVEIFADSTNLSLYNIFAVSPDRKNLCIGSKKGLLYFLKLQVVPTGKSPQSSLAQRVNADHYQLMNFDSNVISLHWLTSHQLVLSTCNQVNILELQRGSTNNHETSHQLCTSDKVDTFYWSVKKCFHINWKDKPGVSAAINVLINPEEINYLILSDELGTVHLFEMGQESKYPLFSLPKIHGTYGVTSFKLGVHKNEVWSVGRNNSVLNLRVETEPHPHLVIVQVVGTCLNWNSKLITTVKGSYICGFSENDFVIIDNTEDKVAKKLPCGGAHRCWDIAFGERYISFVYIRHKQLKLSQFDLDSTTLKSAFYGGKTINVIVSCPYLHELNSKNFCILTGGEDGVLRLSAMKSVGKEFNDLVTCKLAKFKGHVSSVRTVNYHHFIEESSLLVFSGGGRSQIVASIIESRGYDTVWSKKSNIVLQNKQLKTSNPDMRIMDISKSELDEKNQFLLLCAGSDGFLYLISFNITTSKFSHFNTFNTTKPESGLPHSISSVTSSLTNTVVYCSNSIGDVMIYSKKKTPDKDNSMDLRDNYHLYRHQTNAAAITAMKIFSLSDQLGTFIVTGDDEGILKMSLVVQLPVEGKDKINNNAQLAFVSLYEDRKHHSSAINSICVCNNRIFAASADQVVTFRRLDGQNVDVLRCGVSDVQSMTVLPDPFSLKSAIVLLAGQGFESYRVFL